MVPLAPNRSLRSPLDRSVCIRFHINHRPCWCLVADASILATHRFPLPLREKTVYNLIWLVVSTPLKNISNWDDYSQYMEKNKMFQTTNQRFSWGTQTFCPCMPSTCGVLEPNIRATADGQSQARKTGHWHISEVDQNSCGDSMRLKSVYRKRIIP